MRNKIILGSANFDQIYGIKKNFIKKSEIKKLFDLALKNEMKIIDTSPIYKESEKIIGLLNNKRFKIISKISKPPKNIKRENIQKWLKQNVMISLKNLKIKKFECLLLHNANSLLCKNGDEIYPNNNKKEWKNKILKSSSIGKSFYFVHSFICITKDYDSTIAVCNYSDISIPAVVVTGNVFGCQFHPEKSADNGLAVLKNFCET